MSIEIRAVSAEEMQEFSRLVAYVFADNGGDQAQDPSETIIPEWTTCAFVDGRLAATSGAFPFRLRFNGAAAAAAGITMVGTDPGYRRQGLLRRIIAQGYLEQREREQSLAILWASAGAIYQRFGYGLATTMVAYEFDPRYSAFETETRARGSVQLASGEQALPVMKRLYKEYSAPRNLMLHRAQALWQARILRESDNQRVYFAIYSDESGEPRGYAVYSTKPQELHEPGPNQLMHVRDFIPLDMEARRGLWAFFRSHDLVQKIVMEPIADDDPSPQLLLEPRQLRRRTGDGVWLRVVDVERALPQRPYGDSGAITIEVHSDDMCKWNNGVYRLETDGETTETTRTERVPDLTLSPRTLASLISGHTSATDLARCDLLNARDPSSLKLADRLFATEYRPYCPDGF